MLKEGGLKVTPQRMVILQYLANTPEHPGIDAIYEGVRSQLPALSLATIYKTLDTLHAAHLVHRVMTDDGKSRYDANTAPHSHLYCTQTGSIVDIHDPGLNQVVADYLAQSRLENFELGEIQIQLRGRVIDPHKQVIYTSKST